MGSPVFSLKPLRMFGSLNSGKMVETSASRSRRPFSTHCMTETAVTSLVQDAIHMVVSGEMGLLPRGEAASTDSVPKLFWYRMPKKN
jgi:hypothetical protein